MRATILQASVSIAELPGVQAIASGTLGIPTKIAKVMVIARVTTGIPTTIAPSIRTILHPQG